MIITLKVKSSKEKTTELMQEMERHFGSESRDFSTFTRDQYLAGKMVIETGRYMISLVKSHGAAFPSS